MAVRRTLIDCSAAALLLLAAGCGKAEDTRGYTTPGSTSPSGIPEVKTPPPPVPVWAAPLMGRPLTQVSKGNATCKGMIDTITRRHTGPRPGAEIEGWGWDERGAKPLDRVLFTDANGKVVGAATVGNLRPDVPKAMPEVKTQKVGWRGVADVATDEVEAIGVTADGATCTLGETSLD